MCVSLSVPVCELCMCLFICICVISTQSTSKTLIICVKSSVNMTPHSKVWCDRSRSIITNKISLSKWTHQICNHAISRESLAKRGEQIGQNLKWDGVINKGGGSLHKIRGLGTLCRKFGGFLGDRAKIYWNFS